MIRVKDWSEFQHYKNRRPPWIKLYARLMDDPQWFALKDRASWVLASCWLIASEDEDKEGKLPILEKLAFRLRIPEKELSDYIRQLNHWLEFDASDLLAECLQVAIPETEGETDTETEILPPSAVPPGFVLVDERLPIEKPIITSPEVRCASKRYAFESGVIRLNEVDFQKWKDAYSHLDLKAELLSLTQWAETQGGKWFHAVAGALAKRNRDQKEKLERARSIGPPSRRHTASDPLAGII